MDPPTTASDVFDTSTDTCNQPGQRYTPNIPAEIWIIIIQEAICFPRHILYPDMLGLTVGLPSSIILRDQRQSVKKSMATRSHLCRVNKSWHIWTAPFLYEYIILEKNMQPSTALELMARARASLASCASPPALGSATQRLDVNTYISKDMDHDKFFNDLADLLSHLTSLRVLTFSLSKTFRENPRLPAVVVESLKCHKSLKVLHWYTYPYFPIVDVPQFLTDCSSLESINTFTALPSDSQVIDGSLDSLKVIHVHERGFGDRIQATQPWLWAYRLPSVRYGTVEVDFWPDASQLTSFFSSIGRQLVAIQLAQLFKPDVDLKANLTVIFDLVYNYCHNLECVKLVLLTWDMLGLVVPRFPQTVGTLVIRIIKNSQSRSAVNRLFNTTFVQVKACNPQLTTIQFGSLDMTRILRSHQKALAKGLQLANMMGLLILDSHGDVMKIQD